MVPADGKLVALADVAGLVPDGASVALGGFSLEGAPMAFCAELVRAGARDLELVVPVGGMNVDWLLAAGCARRVLTALVGFEGFGLAPWFRRAAEQGLVEVEDWSEHTMLSALQAAILGVPYMPTLAGLGTDLPARLPGRMWELADERSGRRFIACGPLAPDVAVVHVHEADRLGNARVLPRSVWLDGELVKAARTVIVTAERIVDTEVFRAAPERTSYPGFAVDHVVAAPGGAWPTASGPGAAPDAAFYRDYVRAARDPAAFRALFAQRVAPLPPSSLVPA
ncbi:CoA transferase subunit A [Baekduia soli]|nr:CoA transferase subunit A [Baekduia soli]